MQTPNFDGEKKRDHMIFLRSVGFIIVSYTSWIEYKRYERRKMHRELDINDLGQVEQIVYNGLKSGDILIFSRRWYHYHIPMAVSILLYQWFYESEYDHAGVIVVDPKEGVPYLIEINPFTKPIARNLYNRIDHSNSESILLIKLNREIKVLEKPEKLCEEIASKHGMEALSITTAIIVASFKNLWNSNTADVSYCPSTRFLKDFYDQRGFQLKFTDYVQSNDNGSQMFSCKNIFNRDFVLNSKSLEKDKILLSRKDIYLKVR